MPIRTQKVKRETRVDKVTSPRKKTCSRLKSTELSIRGRVKDVEGASLAPNLSDSQSRRDSTLPKAEKSKAVVEGVNPHIQWIPVIAKTGKPLMPTRPKRARELLRAGKAIGKWKVGIFYIQLTQREDGIVQPIAVGIDPGSKREGFTVKSKEHTYLNILSDAVTDVKERMKTRRDARRGRRFRKTPCRKNRINRSRGGIPPSTKARWSAKLRIVNILMKLFPVSNIVVEDIAARTKKNSRKWNVSLSPLEIGKKCFYGEIKKLAILSLKQGYETKEMRDILGLVKTKGKMVEVFSAHNVDSWVLANSAVGGDGKVDNKSIYRMMPLRFHRRQLHKLQIFNGIRKEYGGTMSLGLKRGSLVRHPKWGLCYVGGNQNGRVSLNSLKNGDRICRNAKIEDLKVLRFGSWRYGNAA